MLIIVQTYLNKYSFHKIVVTCYIMFLFLLLIIYILAEKCNSSWIYKLQKSRVLC